MIDDVEDGANDRGWLGAVLHRASLEALVTRWVQDKATDQQLRALRDRIAEADGSTVKS